MPAGGPGQVIQERKNAARQLESASSEWIDQAVAALMAAGPEQWPAEGPLRAALDDYASKKALV
ncbi:MAG TPA: hypothetical protein QGF58_24715 [Myxococcota bacterium]|nr:hypothetical protein [Myxococcota bacterium]